MRVVSGIYRGRHFEIPHTFKARPTTDFAKENLFNVLGNYIDFADGISALDLFSGTGSISIELLSRGCDRVVSVENDSQHLAFIRKIVKTVQTDRCVPLRADALRYIERCREQFDFIFADPPYTLKALPTIPDLIFEHCLLKSEGIFVLEHGKNDRFDTSPHFIEHRSYGSVNFSIFKAKAKSAEEPIHPTSDTTV
ncbi:RsmD family RNA methyltransferase [Phocaeicola abscessus]|uniref:RsmD family RNA methyltransferase n=1 Tax=Phocaeicola abscessus TaxID=555313 RepID=UPI0005679F5A|nr:RsmD family RNA methyltransferase [Phocaeicola abscessus]